MTLRQGSGGFVVGAAPQAPSPNAIVRWCATAFDSLKQFLDGPEFPVVMLSRLDTPLPATFKLQDGMLVYAAAGVIGAAEGLYVRQAGAWKQVTTA